MQKVMINLKQVKETKEVDPKQALVGSTITKPEDLVKDDE